MTAMDKQKRTVHPTIFSSVADVLKAKDLPEVLHSNKSCRNCHRCLRGTRIFNKLSDEKKRRLRNTRAYLSKYRALIEEEERMKSLRKKERAAIRKEGAISLLCETSFQPYESVLAFLSICGSAFADGEMLPVVDPYQVFRFEPVHNLHLPVTRMLHSLTTVWGRSALPRTGKFLNRIGYFLYEADKVYRGAGMIMDFSDPGKDKNLMDCLKKMKLLDCLSLGTIETSNPFYRFWDVFAIGRLIHAAQNYCHQLSLHIGIS